MRVDEKPAMDFPDPMPLPDYTLGSYAMSYLDKMTALCKEKGIELLLVKAPIAYPHWYRQWDEQMVEYAEKNHINYINFIPLQDEIGLDMTRDTYDGGLHLNLTGAEKMASYFGAYLKEHYDLTDYRTNEKYAEVWNKKIENYQKQIKEQKTELEKNGALVSIIPVESKETNVMKNFVIFALIAACCLTLIGCNGKTTDGGEKPSAPQTSTGGETKPESEAPKPTESGSEQTPTVQKGYVLKVGETEIAIGADMAPIAAALGEPTKYFEAPSCAFQGMDKAYTYGGVVIRTSPDEGGKDVVWSIELKDDLTSTTEGVSIGDSKDKVLSIYGSADGEGALLYRKDGMTLLFVFAKIFLFFCAN